MYGWMDVWMDVCNRRNSAQMNRSDLKFTGIIGTIPGMVHARVGVDN